MTTNFRIEEFKCKCGCNEMRMSKIVILLCQMVRNHFNKPVIILSGCRCAKHNEAVGGAKSSQHMPKSFDNQCHASDIYIKGVEPKEVYDFIDGLFPTTLGLGLYSSWVHIDDRLNQAYRWKG